MDLGPFGQQLELKRLSDEIGLAEAEVMIDEAQDQPPDAQLAQTDYVSDARARAARRLEAGRPRRKCLF